MHGTNMKMNRFMLFTKSYKETTTGRVKWVGYVMCTWR